MQAEEAHGGIFNSKYAQDIEEAEDESDSPSEDACLETAGGIEIGSSSAEQMSTSSKRKNSSDHEDQQIVVEVDEEYETDEVDKVQITNDPISPEMPVQTEETQIASIP